MFNMQAASAQGVGVE